MTGKFLLRKDKKPNEYGEYCVYLQYSSGKTPVKKSMDIWIHPDQWLGDDGKSNKYILTGRYGHPQGDLLNKNLVNIKRGFDNQIYELTQDSNTILTVSTLRNILNGTYKEKKDEENGKVPFVQFVLDLNEDLYKRDKISYSVLENVRCNMNQFRKYIQSTKGLDLDDNILYCRDLTVEMIEGYISWRKDKGNSNDTINHSLTPINKTVKKLSRFGWISRETCDEILELTLTPNIRSLGDSTGNDKHYLTEEQVKSLIKVSEECKYHRTKEFVDMFLFSIHCCGLRFSDVMTLKWSEVDFENKVIQHLQVKNHTKKPVILTLPISTECEKILRKWEGKFENFVFGLLPDDFDLTNEKLFRSVKNSQNRCVNQSLRCLGEKIGLPFNLHFHCSRHTFGTMSLNRGVDLNMISNLMGHSSCWVTGKVYSKYLPQTLSKEVNEKLNFKF